MCAPNNFEPLTNEDFNHLMEGGENATDVFDKVLRERVQAKLSSKIFIDPQNNLMGTKPFPWQEPNEGTRNPLLPAPEDAMQWIASHLEILCDRAEYRTLHAGFFDAPDNWDEQETNRLVEYLTNNTLIVQTVELYRNNVKEVIDSWHIYHLFPPYNTNPINRSTYGTAESIGYSYQALENLQIRINYEGNRRKRVVIDAVAQVYSSQEEDYERRQEFEGWLWNGLRVTEEGFRSIRDAAVENHREITKNLLLDLEAGDANPHLRIRRDAGRRRVVEISRIYNSVISQYLIPLNSEDFESLFELQPPNARQRLSRYRRAIPMILIINGVDPLNYFNPISRFDDVDFEEIDEEE